MLHKLVTLFLICFAILTACLQVSCLNPVNDTGAGNAKNRSTGSSDAWGKIRPLNLGVPKEEYPGHSSDSVSEESKASTLRTVVGKNEEGGCAPRSMDEFPKDYFTAEERLHGAALLHAFFGFYCFLVTAYTCNDYLLPALDLICADLKISPNVAGATFLATASCFPELFVSVVGTFLTASDLGVGNVVGGAVFDTFVTPAFGAFSAKKAIELEWAVVSRDCIIYVISVILLVVVMWDGFITWYEATILMIMFVAYLTLLFLNDSLLRCVHRLKGKSTEKSQLAANRDGSISEHESMPSGSFKPFVHGELVAEYRNSVIKAKKLKSIESGISQTTVSQEFEEYVEPDFPFTLPSGSLWTKAWFVFTWPIRILLFVSIPDTRYKKLRNWYALTFVMCVIWIAVTSYMVSWMMTVVGDTLGIADSIMGITFLSAGGNMPELVSIVILSRQGNGDMAMSNTLGANTLDVLLCLGLPWMIRTLMTGEDVEIESGALAYSVMSIIVCVIGFFSVTAYYKFQLNKKVGAVCLIMYALFLTLAILMEMNVFFFVNLPMCDS
ncbi:sodium/potassium/calcium exchanger 4-like [Venturia canescens]|uniref:sodium/potassium/calcium exchanger 4-like n=1 Tax=Venturia canescens TaxID=32260 RepID=UPI001C9C1191|nr:sodium/potassium/calcium exchanger 4-like [Venturia canescens]